MLGYLINNQLKILLGSEINEYWKVGKDVDFLPF